MIDSIQITNFRCFKQLSLEGFGKFNVIVGDNAAGKTALLEAIFLAQAGHPEVVLRLRVWRGLGSVLSLPRSREGYESIWKDLFFRCRQELPIEIATTGTPENTWSLKIHYDPAEPSVRSIDLPRSPSSARDATELDFASITPIKFSHKNDHTSHEFKPIFSKSQMTVEGGDQGRILVAFYTSSFASVVTPSESANQFSELDKKNNAGPVTKAIGHLYPRITSLSVQTDGGMPILYCKTKGMSEKVPIGLESSASQKLTSILLGMANISNGIVLIDEIENGFYYKKLKGVWEALVTFADRFDVQIFASTHSLEFLKATAEVMRGRENDLRLLRAEQKDGKYTVRTFRGDQFEAAIETETEVR